MKSNEEEFKRVENLLFSLTKEHSDKMLVYFSSVTLFENRDYFRHKI
jgi:hypothetical protein